MVERRGPVLDRRLLYGFCKITAGEPQLESVAKRGSDNGRKRAGVNPVGWPGMISVRGTRLGAFRRQSWRSHRCSLAKAVYNLHGRYKSRRRLRITVPGVAVAHSD